ncbi:hypothetical protein AGMMS50229_12390 [Campylobacterota bacterium]|nr:hypothetical protein AGMMS50229_12390 [Campylobacterota bacterium]
MRGLLIFFALYALSLACSGDCVSCHSSLNGKLGRDSDHAVLRECIDCHREITNPSAECGGNCFSCHSSSAINKTTAQHRTLPDCKTCHISSEQNNQFINNLFNFENTLEKTLENTLEQAVGNDQISDDEVLK